MSHIYDNFAFLSFYKCASKTNFIVEESKYSTNYIFPKLRNIVFFFVFFGLFVRTFPLRIFFLRHPGRIFVPITINLPDIFLLAASRMFVSQSRLRR